MSTDDDADVKLVFALADSTREHTVLEFCHDEYKAPIRAWETIDGLLQVRCNPFDLQKLLTEAFASASCCRLTGEPAKTLVEVWQGTSRIFEAVPAISSKVPKYRDVDKRELSRLMEKVDVLLVTATQIEMDAVVSMLAPLPTETLVTRGPIETISLRIGLLGRYVCAHVHCTMGSGGRRGSALAVSDAMRIVSPKAILVLGIAFGADKTKQRLGDVLLAETIIPYEMRREGSNHLIRRGQHLPCGTRLSSRFSDLSDDWVLRNLSGRVRCHRGDVLSGDVLVDSNHFKQRLLTDFPTALGGEMEGAGAYAAGLARNVEVLLVKGICDWADGTKTGHAQSFAAYTAVSLAVHILGKPDVLADLGCSDCALDNTQSHDALPASSPNIVERKQPALYRLLKLFGITKRSERVPNGDDRIAGGHSIDTTMVTLTIKGDLQDLSKMLKTLSLLEKASGGKIKCNMVHKGSTIFELEMPRSAYLVLADLYEAGELSGILGDEVLALAELDRKKSYVHSPGRPIGHLRPVMHTSVVCHLNSIIGFDGERQEALKLLSTQTTRSAQACKVYVTAKDGILYAHSNFIKSGHSYSTKLATTETKELMKVLYNLIADEEQKVAADDVFRLHREDVTYIINAKLVGADGKMLIDVEGAQNVMIVAP